MISYRDKPLTSETKSVSEKDFPDLSAESQSKCLGGYLKFLISKHSPDFLFFMTGNLE